MEVANCFYFEISYLTFRVRFLIPEGGKHPRSRINEAITVNCKNHYKLNNSTHSMGKEGERI